jgi:uncharacterized membrane protein YuzA (DUF378 family)
MKKRVKEAGIVKFIFGMIISNLIRLLQFIPNNDPIMALMLPYAKNDNKIWAMLFPFLTMVSFDLITNKLGIWTLITAVMYSLIGFLFSNFYFKHTNISLFKYIKAGVIGVLLFDFVTGPIMSSWMFSMTFQEAFFGQIPFTILHLITVSAYIVVLVPLLDKHLVKNEKLNDKALFDYFKNLLLTRA